MRGKQAICTTRLDVPMRVNGSGELYRLSMAQRVHAGPATVVDRQVTLVMDQDEAIQTALDILNRVEIGTLKKRLPDLQKLVKMLSVLE